MASLLRGSSACLLVLVGLAFDACSVSTHGNHYGDGGTGGAGGCNANCAEGGAGAVAGEAGSAGDSNEGGAPVGGSGPTLGEGGAAGFATRGDGGAGGGGGDSMVGGAAGESGAAGSGGHVRGGTTSAGGQPSAQGGALAQGGAAQGGAGQGGKAASGGSGTGGQPPALKKDGEACTAPAECSTKSCTQFYVDADGDGYGVKLSPKMLCGSSNVGYAVRDGDCCDTDADAHPGVTDTFGVLTACGNYDYDCSKTVEVKYASIFNASVCTSCGSYTSGWKGDTPACGDFGQLCNCSSCTEQCNQTQQTCR